MNRTNYLKPSLRIVELSAEQMIATSGDANGTIDKMPWGSNKMEESGSIWEESGSVTENRIWK